MEFAKLPVYFWPYLLLGIIYLIFILHKKMDRFFYLSRGFLAYIFLYLALLENQHQSHFFLIPLGFFIIFYLFFRQQRAQVRNGFLFNCFIVSFGLYLLYNYFITRDLIVFALISAVAVVVLAVAIFGLIGLIILLYWNALVVMRRESHSLANLLTLILALVLTVWLIYDHFISGFLPDWATTFLAILPTMFLYFAVVFLNFFTASFLYQFNHPKYKQDFIIVLGAGLINGDKVSPLLAKRIDKAIRFYRKQIDHGGYNAKIILSGGQGPDEKIPEALAMKEYALSHDLPTEDLLVETNSKTTLENMQYSKEIIEKSTINDPKIIFSSNNYHIFRAGIYAEKAQLKAVGIGCRTALYYLPNAFLREFIAIVAMQRKKHFIIVISLAVIIFLLALLNLFF